MNKTKQPIKNKFSWQQIILIILGVIIGLGLLAALVIWVLWPIRKQSLQTAQFNHFSFSAAQQKITQINQAEKAANIKPACYSKAYTHPKPAAKAVVMFHGVGACPLQFSNLAQYFYDHGYNVYVPRAPRHGYPDNLQHAKVTAQELVDYTNTSLNITDALGAQVGVIGLSGGANLATWASQYRPDVSRTLTLSPFYEPSRSQAPKWQIRPLMVLYGNHFVPDALNKPSDPQHALSYYALAQYVTVFHNLPRPAKATNLRHLAVVMAADDNLIDQSLALKTLTNIAAANHTKLEYYQAPARLQLGHDIISPDNKYVVAHQAFLLQKYFGLYER